MKKKILILLISLLSIGCSNTKTISYDENVKSIRRLGYVSGSEAFYDTSSFGLGSCDLGYPLYIEERDQMYYFFGDSFTQSNQSGTWRSNVVGISYDFKFSDGLSIDDTIYTKSGFIKTIYQGHHVDKYEMTKIPTGVVIVNGVIYMYYFSIYSWNSKNDNRMNYGGCIKSNDLGETWERIYDLTWVNLSPDKTYGTDNNENNFEALDYLINEDINNNERITNKISIDDHLGFDSVMIYPYLHNDGYVYFFIEAGYRNNNLKLSRVKQENIEKYEEYEYMIRYDSNNNPVYVKGSNGLAQLYRNPDSEICKNRFGEMSAVYNPYLKKYCILTVSTGSVDMFISPNIYGPYEEKIHLYSAKDEICPISSTTNEPINSAYAPMTHEKMLSKGGKVMYVLTSTWIPCYNPSLYEVVFK